MVSTCILQKILKWYAYLASKRKYMYFRQIFFFHVFSITHFLKMITISLLNAKKTKGTPCPSCCFSPIFLCYTDGLFDHYSCPADFTTFLTIIPKVCCCPNVYFLMSLRPLSLVKDKCLMFGLAQVEYLC